MGKVRKIFRQTGNSKNTTPFKKLKITVDPGTKIMALIPQHTSKILNNKNSLVEFDILISP